MSTVDMWNRFEKTDPAHTKQFTRGGGFKGTAINGTYILKRLTTEFGPCGKGWRFVLEDEHTVDGHTLKNGIDRAKVHVVRGHLEYILDGAWHSTSPQFGQTMFVDENKYGPFTDEEAPKKSITDCISKCAVLLGIGADVHLGLFDDNKYVNQRRAEEAAENGNGNGNHAPAPTARVAEQRGEEPAKAEPAVVQFLKGKNLGIAVPGLKAQKPDFKAWQKFMFAAIDACRDEPVLTRLWADNADQAAALRKAMPELYDEIERYADQRRYDLTQPVTIAAE